MNYFKADEDKGTERKGGEVALRFQSGGPGSPNCPKRKRAYFRALKSGRYLPGLTDFHMNRLMRAVAEKWNNIFLKSISSDLPMMGLSDLVRGDIEIKVERGDGH